MLNKHFDTHSYAACSSFRLDDSKQKEEEVIFNADQCVVYIYNVLACCADGDDDYENVDFDMTIVTTTTTPAMTGLHLSLHILHFHVVIVVAGDEDGGRLTFTLQCRCWSLA